MWQTLHQKTILNETKDKLEIISPSRKNIRSILFMIFGVCASVAGEISGITLLIRSFNNSELPLYAILLWLIFWTLGSIALSKMLLWSVVGKEIITFSKSRITLVKNYGLFSSRKDFKLNKVKYLRLNDKWKHWSQRDESDAEYLEKETILFDYGEQTIACGSELSKSEAEMIIRKLKTMKIL